MKMSFKTHVFYILILLNLFSCASLKKGKTDHVKTVETEVERDASVPAGYKPNIITGLEKFRTDTSINYQMKVINTLNQKGKLNVDFNIGDDKGRLYLQANADKWKKSWCALEERSGDKVLPVKKYVLNHRSELEHVPHNFVFVIDQSISMGEMRVFTAQNAIANLVSNDKLPEDAIAVIKYDSKPVLEVPLTSNADKFMELFKFSSVSESGGQSAINDALDLAIDVLSTDSVKKERVVVIFTDGIENGSKKGLNEIVSKARANRIKVCTIDFGNNTDAQYMSSLAKLTGGCYDHIYKTNEFNFIFNAIYKRMKNCYTVDYIPSFFNVTQLKLILCNNAKKIEFVNEYNNELIPGNRILVSIPFDLNKSQIKSVSMAEIDRIVGIMKNESSHQFEIQVHTDEAADGKTNLGLSQKRADAIKAELIRKGIEKDKVNARGMGRSVLLADPKSKDGKLMNRRVELVVVQ